ncbi:MAG: hypothetical protein ACI4F9_04080 [Lachnospiraceae bacterium]
MGKTLNTDALIKLINAVNTYQGELQQNAQILYQAGQVCSDTMGNDAIIQKHLLHLEQALGELQRASQIASDASRELILDYQRAMSVHDSI